MTSFARLFRDRAGDDSCPDHGPLRGQTRCRFCGYDPISPRTVANLLPGDGVSSLLSARREVFTPLQVQQDGEQKMADVSHGQKNLAGDDPTTPYFAVGAGCA